MKKLYLSQKDKKLFGFCGGIGEFFNVDTTLIRIIWIILTVLTGIAPFVLIYIVAVLVTPKGENKDTIV